MKRRAESVEELHDFGGNTIYCEAGAQEEDVLYQGSEDEYYESAAARKLQYEAAGQRFLDGRSAFVLTANLKGPFDSESGWENPWISRNQSEKARDLKRKAQSHTPVQKGTARSLVACGGARSNSQECCLPSPESLVQSVQGDHLNLEKDEFDHVRKWRLEVKPMVETASVAFGEHSAGQSEQKRSRGSEQPLSRKNKRARTEPVQLRVTKTPTRKSLLMEQAETPCNRPKPPQSSPILRQTQSILTPSTRHSSVRKFSTFSNMKRPPRDELRGFQHEASDYALRQRASPGTRASPNRNFPKAVDGHDENSEDELSVTQQSAKTLIPELRNDHTRRSFPRWPKVPSATKEIKFTPETTMAAEEHDGDFTNDVAHDSTHEETTSTGSDCTDEIAREATGETITDWNPTGLMNMKQSLSLGESNHQRMQLGRLRNRSTIQAVRTDLAASEDDEIEVTCRHDDAVSTSSLSSLHSVTTPFGSSILHRPPETNEFASSDQDDIVSTSSLSSLHEPFSPWVAGLSVMRSELGKIKHRDHVVAKSSSPLSELSEAGSWSGISDRILQIDNGPLKTLSFRSKQSKQRRIPATTTALPYRQLRRSPIRRKMRSPARLRSGRLRVTKPIHGHNMALRNRPSGPLTSLTFKPAIRVRQANMTNANLATSSKTNTRPNNGNKDVCKSKSGLSDTQHAARSNSTTRSLSLSPAPGNDCRESDAESSHVSKTPRSNTMSTFTPCAVHLGSTPQSPSPVTLPVSSSCASLSEASAQVKAVERSQENGADRSMDSSVFQAGEQLGAEATPQLEGNTQRDSDGAPQNAANDKSAFLRVELEDELAESQGASSGTTAAIPTSGTSQVKTSGVIESSESSERGPDSVTSVPSEEEALHVLPSNDATPSKIDVPVPCVMSPKLHPQESAFHGSSNASNSQGQTRNFVQPHTPEPEFTIKSFASFMSPSPNRRAPSWLASVRLSSSGHRGILRVPKYPREPKKRVSWATLAEDNAGRSPILRPASPPPSAPMEELPLSSADKFREHFHAVVHRAEGLKGVQSREAGPRDKGNPSGTTGSDASTTSQGHFESEESRQSRHMPGELSQDFVFDLNDIFDEMGDVLKTWNVDNELEVARKSATVL